MDSSGPVATQRESPVVCFKKHQTVELRHEVICDFTARICQNILASRDPITNSTSIENKPEITDCIPIDNELCTICRDKKEKCNIETKCGHFFHRKCIEEYMKFVSRCPNCRQELDNT